MKQKTHKQERKVQREKTEKNGKYDRERRKSRIIRWREKDTSILTKKKKMHGIIVGQKKMDR